MAKSGWVAIASSGSQTWKTGITTSVVAECGWFSANASDALPDARRQQQLESGREAS
jgi:hypothetical protein